MLSEHFSMPMTVPRRLEYPASWAGHWPFAYWLMQALQPQQTVELGTHSGNSFFAFCQSAQAHHLSVKVTAVDTWDGDDHAGSYGQDIYDSVLEHAQTHYAQIAQLKRMRFDVARQDFSEHSIDLLHIDGLHTYEAVRHDFETWRGACRPNALVLFHDTQVQRDDFGVWRFWQELQAQFPHFEFVHSHGLGVICLGDIGTLPNSVQALFEASHQGQAVNVQTHFAAWGNLLIEQIEAEHRQHHISLELAQTKRALQESQARERALLDSLSWRITAPLRALKRLWSNCL